MALFEKYITTKIDKSYRLLAKIFQTKSGDVYIALKSGLQIGLPPNELKIKQHRYSIHLSPNSKNYSVFKMTRQFADGRTQDLTALTTALKHKDGFSHLFSHRCSDMADVYYDYLKSPSKRLTLVDLNPIKHCLLYAVFVGHKDTKFSAKLHNCTAQELIIGDIKLVFLSSYINMPSIPASITTNSATFKESEKFTIPNEIPIHYRARSPEECHALFQTLASEHAVLLLETVKHFVDEEKIPIINQMIAGIPRGPLLRIGY